MSVTVYILKLEGGYYYIGKTKDVLKTYQEHMSGKAHIFTQHYKPISVEKVYENIDPSYEERIVNIYIKKYGTDKVFSECEVVIEEEMWECSYCDREFDDDNDCLNHETFCKTRITSVTSATMDECFPLNSNQ
jgi:predicted GIY-YIG superfamily endonuclease